MASDHPAPRRGPAGPDAARLGPGHAGAFDAAACSCEDDPAEHWDLIRAYAAKIDASGLATVQLAAPFIPTIVGTDTYTDQLW